MPGQPPRARVDLSRLPPLSHTEPLRLSPRRLPRRLIRHPWTDEELNLISYLRLYHNWTWSRIRRTHFPSMSNSAISNAYTRISNEDRVYRASLVASLAHNNSTTNTTGAANVAYREILARASSSRRRPSRLSRSTCNSAPQFRNHAETVNLSTSSSEDEGRSITHNSTTTRYIFDQIGLETFRKVGRYIRSIVDGSPTSSGRAKIFRDYTRHQIETSSPRLIRRRRTCPIVALLSS